MSHTNSTSNYGLPQWIGTDKPTFLGDFNTAFYNIDAQMKTNADAAASATTTANTAASAATTASTNATTALNTANSAASEAASATSAAASATATANTAAANAATALTASQANNIANLAPAYDPTLTYAVGDLVTYVDTETNTGKLYKCIVAVGTPEAFNINKWDDVTTSEVYARMPKTLASVTADGVLTWGDIYNQLYNDTVGLDLSNTELHVSRPSTGYHFKFVITEFTPNTSIIYNTVAGNDNTPGFVMACLRPNNSIRTIIGLDVNKSTNALSATYTSTTDTIVTSGDIISIVSIN